MSGIVGFLLNGSIESIPESWKLLLLSSHVNDGIHSSLFSLLRSLYWFNFVNWPIIIESVSVVWCRVSELHSSCRLIHSLHFASSTWFLLLFKIGECTRGDTCKFSHVIDPNAVPPARSDFGSRPQRDFGSRPAGVCYAFQRGECDRGSNCRFSHSAGGDRGEFSPMYSFEPCPDALF